MQKSRKEQLLDFLKEEPADVFLLYALALEHIKESDEEKAAGLLDSVIRIDPGYVAAYYQLGKLYEKGNPDRACEIYLLGMEAAKGKGDRHAFNELNTAYKLAKGIFDEEDEE